MRSRRKLKSGLLVLVDLFSLLTMAMFSVFVVSSDVRTSDVPATEGLKVIQVTIQPESEVTNLNSPWRPIEEIVKVRPRLATADGETISPIARGLTVEIVIQPDGFNYSVIGDSRGLFLHLDVAEISLPLAFLTSFQIELNELTPNPGNFSRSEDVQLGNWNVPAFAL